MSVLSNKDIKQLIKEKQLSFSPNLDKFQLQTHSVDLRLGYTFLIRKTWKLTKAGREVMGIDTLNQQRKNFDVVELEQGQYFELAPGEHVTVVTLETISMPDDVMAVLYPRSSVNRRGISVDLTGIIDAGYKGQLIIPMRNNSNQIVRVYPGERFCQLVFEKIQTKTNPRKSRHHMTDVAVDNPRPEKRSEISLVLKGDIKELKSKYGLDIK